MFLSKEGQGISDIGTEDLRKKLVDAERKYYNNLRVLEEKLARLEALQILNRGLMSCTDSTMALGHLVDTSVLHMAVEKALVVQPTDGGYAISAMGGYSRSRSQALMHSMLPIDGDGFCVSTENTGSSLFDSAHGVAAEFLDLCQMVVCPLKPDDGNLLGFYIAGFSRKKIELFRQFESIDLAFFDMVAAQVSSAVQNLQIKEEFRKFVPFEFLELLHGTSKQTVQARDHVALDMHVMFADLRKFTTLSEAMGAEAVFTLLNEYLSEVEPVIAGEGGFINQYQGDAIIALFSGGADKAIHAAIKMYSVLDRLNMNRKLRDEVPLQMGIGINSGRLLLGAIGSDKRLDSNVVGDAANLASRVESMTKIYGAKILISGHTLAEIEDPSVFFLRELDRVIVAGKTEAIYLYEVLDADDSELKQQKKANSCLFTQGLECYRKGDFRDARLIFAECLVSAPLDEAAALYIGRCAELIGQAPAGHWDGTTVLLRK